MQELCKSSFISATMDFITLWGRNTNYSKSFVCHYPYMASGPITSWQIDGETVETMADFISGGSKITADGDCSHEIKRRLLLGSKVMTNLDSIFKSRNITLPTKVRSLSLFTSMQWRRKWQPTPVFLPGESQGWGSLVGC